ncbi:MAG: glycosyltransferase family 4 protein [Actinobacteria bacterium]|nr:glycosyltransferase family 4 protein [Actinomycetota bacterium]
MSRPDHDLPRSTSEAPLRVLHCLWDGSIGGAERALYQLVLAQADSGTVAPGLLVATTGGYYAERVREAGLPVKELSAARGMDVRAVVPARSSMRAWDVHHFHSMEPLLFAASLAVPGVVRAFTARGGEPQEAWPLGKRVRHCIGGVMLRRGFHAFSANTRHAADVAERRYGLAPGSVAVTPNGLDFALLKPERPREEVRRELGAGPEDVLVGTAAVLKPWKRVERLVEAVAAVADPRVRGVVIGDGPDRGRLEARARALGVAGRMRFTGMLERVADHVAALDVFALTSGPQESFGNAIVEAMALGVPSIAFADSPGALEHVREKATGLVVRDVADLAQAISALVGDAARRSVLGRTGAAEVRARYTVDRMVEGYARLYRSANARSRRSRASFGGRP